MRIGEYQKLYYKKKVDFGIYLSDDPAGDNRVLLPEKQVPDGLKIGDALRVFLYRDSRDRLIATTNEPKLTLGGCGVLAVKEIGKIGAFLDWGLEKDLFLPYKEMTERPEPGDEILVTKDSPYQKGDTVTGRVYEFSDNFGAFVAVDDRYSARIAESEDHSFLRIGDVIEAKVTGVKPDGKLDLTMRQPAYIQMEDDANHILTLLDSYGGVLPFTEKATPEVIRRETGLSKAAFKRAVGRLYRERKVVLKEGKIRRASEEQQRRS